MSGWRGGEAYGSNGGKGGAVGAPAAAAGGRTGAAPRRRARGGGGGRGGGGERHRKAAGARGGRSGPPPLKRGIGRVLLLFFVIGDIVGAGIYALVGEVGAVVGGAIWAAFLAAFVLAIFTAASYVELVTKYPRAGGSATYAHNAFRNPFVSFIVAFAVAAARITSASGRALALSGGEPRSRVPARRLERGLRRCGVQHHLR